MNYTVAALMAGKRRYSCMFRGSDQDGAILKRGVLLQHLNLVLDGIIEFVFEYRLHPMMF